MLKDFELQALLRERGYVVPMIVIRTWEHHRNYNGKRSAFMVQRWLLHDYSGPGRKPKFPQFLAPFDTQIQRIQAREREERLSTPRLER